MIHVSRRAVSKFQPQKGIFYLKPNDNFEYNGHRHIFRVNLFEFENPFQLIFICDYHVKFSIRDLDTWKRVTFSNSIYMRGARNKRVKGLYLQRRLIKDII